MYKQFLTNTIFISKNICRRSMRQTSKRKSRNCNDFATKLNHGLHQLKLRIRAPFLRIDVSLKQWVYLILFVVTTRTKLYVF